MKFKFRLLESDLPTGRDGDAHIYFDEETNSFYWFNQGKFEPVPKVMQKELLHEKERQERIERKKQADPNFDEDEYNAKRAEKLKRIQARFNGSASDKMDKLGKESKKVKDKQIELRAKTAKKDSKKKKYNVETPSSVKTVIEEIIADLQDNILDNDEEVWDWEATYNRPNPYSIDPSIMLKYDTYELQPEPEDEDKPKPYIYFIFDRSCSFDGGKKRNGVWDDPNAGWKVDMGKAIENELIEQMSDGRIVFKTYYFASAGIFENEQEALNCGGNDGDKLIADLATLTEGQLANVIIITDSDNARASNSVSIDGGVWLIFCDQYDEGLHNKIVGTKVNREFFFTQR